MNLKTIKLVLDNNGNLIDKSYGTIIGDSNYKYKLQVISPALQTSSVDVTIDNDKATTNYEITKRMRLAKDTNGNYIKGSDVVHPDRTYYNAVSDFNVWEKEIEGTMLSILTKTNSTKALVSVSISESVDDPNAINYLGTFGKNTETVVDIPTPTTEVEGDYYVCNVLNYTSSYMQQEFGYKDIVYFDGVKWVKGLNFRFKYSTTPTQIVIQPTLLSTYTDVEPTLTQDLVDAISELDGISQSTQLTANTNKSDISSLQTAVQNKEDKLPARNLNDANKFVKLGTDGVSFIYQDVPVSTEDFQNDILELREADDTINATLVEKSDIGHLHVEADITDLDKYTKLEVDNMLATKLDSEHNHDTSYYLKTEVDTLLNTKSDDTHNHNTLYKDINYIPTWIEITSKPTEFTPEAHTHDYIPTSEKGVANGVAELDSSGQIPSTQLPSYVDDVVEYASSSSFPTTGESGKLYIALDTNLQYRWSGTQYVEISKSLALGETSSTAYRGDHGLYAYNHSLLPHDYEPSFSKNTAFNKPFGTEPGTVAEGSELSKYEPAFTKNTAFNKPFGNTVDTVAEGNHTHNYEPAFTKNTAFNKPFGNSTNTVCQGNDTRLSNSRTCNNTFDSASTSRTNLGLTGTSNTTHYHDSRYYTESEMNTKLAAKSDTTHTHFSYDNGILYISDGEV